MIDLARRICAYQAIAYIPQDRLRIARRRITPASAAGRLRSQTRFGQFADTVLRRIELRLACWKELHRASVTGATASDAVA